jgi:hypothetical protein
MTAKETIIEYINTSYINMIEFINLKYNLKYKNSITDPFEIYKMNYIIANFQKFQEKYISIENRNNIILTEWNKLSTEEKQSNSSSKSVMEKTPIHKSITIIDIDSDDDSNNTASNSSVINFLEKSFNKNQTNAIL